MPRNPLLALSTIVFFASCAGESPAGLAEAEMTPSFTMAGASGCYAVSGTISETGFFPDFAGTVSGDIEGTSTTTVGFDGINGKVITNPGVRSIQVTGGSVAPLIGTTLEQSFNGLSINTGAGPVRINERTTVESGAARGTLTTHGWLDLEAVPWAVEVTYRGVICP